MNFFLLLGKNYLQIFDIANNYEKIYINGESDIYYDLTKSYVISKELINNLRDQYNLANEADIVLKILKNADNTINDTVMKALAKYIKTTYALDDILISIINSLSQKDTLMIKEYGINYDGKCYKLDLNKLLVKDFSLLAYTLRDTDIINSIKYSNK